jgi:voltage-gated sodium channel
VQKFFQATADNEHFQGFILGLIVFNALCMGAEATPGLAELYAGWWYWIFVISQVVFVLEIGIRLLAHYPRVGEFFRDSWNRFDFVVVALSLLPAVGGMALAARLLRVLRILRVISVSDTMRGLFDREHRGLPTLTLTAVTLAILGYIFALSGFHLFGEPLPEQWGSLSRSLSSVVRLILMQRPLGFIRPAYERSPWSLLYFALLYALALSLLSNAIGVLFSIRRIRSTGDAK